MTAPLRVLVVTDSFPPACGGSGWSTWELARGLTEQGHLVDVVHVAAGRSDAVTTRSYEGVPVTMFTARAPQIPFVRNYFKNERLWDRLGRFLDARLSERGVDIVHAQHVMTTVPAVAAGRRRGVPVVATVRDYWPVCYWSDLIYDPAQPRLCPACTPRMMTRCLQPRAGLLTPAAWPMIPYMRANLARKRRGLAGAAAIIAVSSTLRDDLDKRAPEVPADRLHTIPNPFDFSALDRDGDRDERPMAGPYLLYVGKLATNKGAQFLLRAVADAKLGWPVVVVGDGPLRQTIEGDARRSGIDLTITGWVGRDEVWRWMRHATVMAFPSYGPESLSRVLVEAAALGVPIAAMTTGGTRDILRHGDTALLSADAAGLSADLGRLAGDPALCARLGLAARTDVRARFGARSVVGRIVDVYRHVIGTPR